MHAARLASCPYMLTRLTHAAWPVGLLDARHDRWACSAFLKLPAEHVFLEEGHLAAVEAFEALGLDVLPVEGLHFRARGTEPLALQLEAPLLHAVDHRLDHLLADCIAQAGDRP